MLGCSYLLVTGFMGLASRDFRFGMNNNEDSNMIYLVSGAIFLVIVLFCTYAINYSFSSSYIVHYVNNNGKTTSSEVWKAIKKNLGTIVAFMLIGVLFYIGYIIITMIVSFIPLIGMFVQYGLSFLLSAVYGLTFVSIFEKNKGFSAAMGEGWDFSISNFLLVIGYGLVIGLLNTLLTLLVLSIPGFLFFFFVYFSVQDQFEFYESTTATVVFTLSFCIFIITFTFSQSLSQLAYGVLYYNMHEKKYNTYLQSRIDKIGVSE